MLCVLRAQGEEQEPQHRGRGHPGTVPAAAVREVSSADIVMTTNMTRMNCLSHDGDSQLVAVSCNKWKPPATTGITLEK